MDSSTSFPASDNSDADLCAAVEDVVEQIERASLSLNKVCIGLITSQNFMSKTVI